jgi:hypothetical protein
MHLHKYLPVYIMASFFLTLDRRPAVKLDNLCLYGRVAAHHGDRVFIALKL